MLLFAEDETDLLLFPPLRAGWARVGEPVRVPLHGYNARRVVFGAMELRSGERVFVECERQRSADFQALLWAVRQKHLDQEIAMLLDEDPSHTAKASLALACQLQIRLLWLPKRASELNPMDTLWGHAKDVVCANKQYESIDEQVHRFVEFLKRLSDEEALSLAGICLPDFWLKNALSKDFLRPA